MASRSRGLRRRTRVGRVSCFWHHGAWHIYYREGQRQVRRRVGTDQAAAERAAAEVNAQLANQLPGMFTFEPLAVAEIRQRFLDHHEYVLRSSLATVCRYRAATQHLVNFSQQTRKPLLAHQVDADGFTRHLRQLRISPNGHRNAERRPLRDKGIRFILETCRSLYAFANKRRHLPPYSENPFTGLGGKRNRVEDQKPIFLFDERSELAFFQQSDAWAFPLHFLLAKSGLRPGEAVRLLIEDLDLEHPGSACETSPNWAGKSRRAASVLCP